MLELAIRTADRAVHGLLRRLLHDRLLGSLLLERNKGNGSSISHNLRHSMKRIGFEKNVVSVQSISLWSCPVVVFLSQPSASTAIVFTPMFQKFKGKKATVRLR